MARIELPWALQTSKADPNRLFYFRTKAEAEKSKRHAIRKGHYAGDIVHRPGKCFQLTEINELFASMVR